MSPFVIFVIVLTIIYIIYYAVMITRDLYGKKAHKFEKKSDEIQPSMSDGMYADDFYQTLLNGNRTNRPQIKIEHIRNEL